ncbi:DUF1801 domain-containing protein [Cytophaga hutchinsonii]|uniref:YdhG-like domain-containing protein n=1 Tax=Cytophaga hutchinsonii (strain ATCC 33406 / DSM 1761 / CIP 103989 / NBRC 15051 / NCIMB 9469 / D465) TaxID=269798 RepID=A0A6N4SUG2_CYTH3|nr:DUF1801 domain-containing protein [Cytophaga hutchinsonii]ABG59862.1 conserved hypothetical protein [Cytophaga hutchinsonii ATCC 33406]SFX28558.1 protein of unknown function (DU1801) [Cytophaga hutchinsonii ATCC 33406]
MDITSVNDYITQLPEDRKKPVEQLRAVLLASLPKGFAETITYGMIGYVVPHSLYPKGYHADPALPLPFITIASQKNHIAVYHMGIYSHKELLEWFTKEYYALYKTKPDMGKSCMRFKNLHTIPYTLIGELAGKISVKDWIHIYETSMPAKK